MSVITDSGDMQQRVAIVGGVDRIAPVLERVAADLDFDLELHDGHTSGRGAPGLAAMIGRADVVVIVTDVNSHNAVIAARKLAGSLGRRTVIVRKLGPSKLASILGDLSTIST